MHFGRRNVLCNFLHLPKMVKKERNNRLLESENLIYANKKNLKYHVNLNCLKDVYKVDIFKILRSNLKV